MRENNKYENYRDLVLEEYSKGNIVYQTVDGPQVVKLEDFLKQPAEGILYDLNRDRATVLTFIKDEKWMNDYAVSVVITELKRNYRGIL